MADDAAEKSPSKGLNIGLWVVQGMLAFAFMMAGGMKLATPPPELVENGMAFAGRMPEAAVKFIETWKNASYGGQ